LPKNNYITAIKSTRPHVTTALGLSDEEFNEVSKRLEEELTTPNDYHPIIPLFNNYGRKKGFAKLAQLEYNGNDSFWNYGICNTTCFGEHLIFQQHTTIYSIGFTKK